jgi:anion-transporting  ArsA/GET3 family ATPase
MAMEKLYELHQEGRYDLLVLDTPPTRNALDFLDAPRRLSAFVDSRALQFFTAPGRLGLRVLGRGSSVVFSVLKRLTGIDLLQDLSEFFRAFGDMSTGFRERAEHVNALLADSRTAFLLVTSPRRDAIEEAGWFHHRLLDSGLPFAGAVVNRMHPLTGADGRRPDLEPLLGQELALKVERNLEDYRRLAERDRENLELLAERLGRKPLLRVPELDEDVHDLAGLARMNDYLFAQTGAE